MSDVAQQLKGLRRQLLLAEGFGFTRIVNELKQQITTLQSQQEQKPEVEKKGEAK